MATKRDLALSIAAKLLTGDGLKVAQLTADAMLKQAMKGDDLAHVRSLSKISDDLQKLADREAGGAE